MRFFFTAFVASIATALAAPLNAPAGSAIPNQYIVVYKPTANSASIASHENWLKTSALAGQDAPVFRRSDGASFPAIPRFSSFSYLHKYTGTVRGYAARLSPQIAAAIASLPEVELIEQDSVVTAIGGGGGTPSPTTTAPVPTGTSTPPPPPPPASAPYGLRRLSQPNLPLPSVYTYNSAAGAGVDAYVIDTGVFISHPEFEGRARVGASFSTDNNDVDANDVEGNGHGTHVAGTIGSRNYGVAKKVNIIAVKVLSSSGSGSNSDVIAGINWVATNAPKTGRPSVANMSLGGGATASLDAALKAAVDAGVTFVVAAGNNGADACSNSPARAPSAITVAASDSTDTVASFSDQGSCVDIVAPGVNVLSTWNNGSTRSISGTSMASPHVAGVVAVALSTGISKTPASVAQFITSTAASGKIKSLKANTVNLLAQVPQ
ncbi:subtilisin-like serine protease [Phlyctochytrium planicorne]|nr:subtilisin-like serine protease [Phlyctochytrium planicorne]